MVTVTASDHGPLSAESTALTFPFDARAPGRCKLPSAKTPVVYDVLVSVVAVKVRGTLMLPPVAMP